MSAAPSVVGGIGRSAAEGPEAGATMLDLVLARVRALARRRLAWVEHLSAGKSAPGVVRAADLDLALEGRDAPRAELAWRERAPGMDTLAREIDRCDQALAADRSSPLAQLCRTFELGTVERDAVQVCVATVLDPGLAKVWAFLHGHPAQNYPSEALVMRVFGDSDRSPLPRAGVLFRWEIVRAAEISPGDPAPLVLDPHILEFLCGHLTIDPLLAGRAGVVSPLEAPASWPVAEVVARIRRAVDDGMGVRISLAGPRRSGRRTFAACVTAGLGAPALAIDTTGVAPAEWPAFHLHAQRQALLFGSSLIWCGDAAVERLPPAPGLARLQFVTGDGELAPSALPGVIDERVSLPPLSIDERALLWRRLVPSSQAWPERERRELCERHQVQIGDIAWMGEHGVDSVAQAKAECRELTRHKLGELGRPLDCPFARADLTLAASLNQLLDAFLFEARERARFWEAPAARRLFPRGRGLVMLMTGPPGTGKTMTAQVVAAELGLDLVRVDLASTVNKYIGETAKNLRRIFARAVDMNAVLLFDEADALFAKRTEVRDAHDRYANADTNYLLQLLEDFDGVALLSSNKKQNMDSAFVRRLRYVMDFPRPKPAERLLIWQHLVSELVGIERAQELAPVLRDVADTLDLSGAQIKLALLAGIFDARQA